MSKKRSNKNTNYYLFILSPPYSGSTLLSKILGTSPEISSLPKEGQSVDGVSHVMPGSVLLKNPELEVPWKFVKRQWEQKYWDLTQQILLEKSPSNIHRAFEIQNHFYPSSFIALIRNPYAFCEGYERRKRRRTYQEGARLWVRCAQSQRQNVERLKRVVQIRYEDLTDDTKTTLRRIEAFMPELREIQTSDVPTQTLLGRQSNIRNINDIKIKKLTQYDIRKTNGILERYEELVSFFGYKIRDPKENSRIKSLIYNTKPKIIRMLRYLNRIKVLPNKLKNRIEKYVIEQ